MKTRLNLPYYKKKFTVSLVCIGEFLKLKSNETNHKIYTEKFDYGIV